MTDELACSDFGGVFLGPETTCTIETLIEAETPGQGDQFGRAVALRGDTMEEAHPEFTFHKFRLAGLGAPPPLDVMAIRPRMVQLACRIGDGISLSIGASKHYLHDVLRDIDRELDAAGRKRSQFRITALAMVSIGRDIDKACRPIAAINAGADQATAAFLARGVVDPAALNEI